MEQKFTVSVVVNAYNEEKNIGDCMSSLNKQSLKNFEVIFVDDGSTDRTVEIVKRFRNKLDLKIVLLSHAGHRKARRKGISKATGDIVVIVDADEILEPGFLENIVEPFEKKEVGAVGGILKSMGERWANRAYGALQEMLYQLRKNGDGEIDWIQGGCSAYRRSLLTEVGGLSEDMVSTDKDISWRIKDAGWKIILKEEAVAYHKDPSSLRSLAKREYKNGKKEYNLLKKHGKFGWKELSRFYTLMGLMALVIVPFFPLLLILILLGFLLTFMVTAYQINKHVKDRHLGISFTCWVVLTVINLGWSLGYIHSLLIRGDYEVENR